MLVNRALILHGCFEYKAYLMDSLPAFSLELFFVFFKVLCRFLFFPPPPPPLSGGVIVQAYKKVFY